MTYYGQTPEKLNAIRLGEQFGASAPTGGVGSGSLTSFAQDMGPTPFCTKIHLSASSSRTGQIVGVWSWFRLV